MITICNTPVLSWNLFIYYLLEKNTKNKQTNKTGVDIINGGPKIAFYDHTEKKPY